MTNLLEFRNSLDRVQRALQNALQALDDAAENLPEDVTAGHDILDAATGLVGGFSDSLQESLDSFPGETAFKLQTPRDRGDVYVGGLGALEVLWKSTGCQYAPLVRKLTPADSNGRQFVFWTLAPFYFTEAK